MTILANDLASSQPSLRACLRNVELFGGAGGLALGLHAAGFHPVALIENDRTCLETLEANGKDGKPYTAGWNVQEQSVADFDYSTIDQIELLSAGAPCQPFSHAGHRLGHMDARNLFPEVVRALHALKPPAFVIENVRGLLFKDMELYFKGLLRELRRPSAHHAPRPYATRGRPPDEYRVFFRVLNAADFGLAQNRLRLFIIGLKPGLADGWSWPVATHSKESLLKALLADEYWDHHAVAPLARQRVRERIAKSTRKRLERSEEDSHRWRTVRDLIACLTEPAENKESATDPSHYLVPGARLYERHTGSKLDWPAKTVKAGVHGCPGGEHIVILDDGTHRYFTVRECGLLQGFPSGYVFADHRSNAMRQIGNAVPVPVATAVGEQLAEVLADA
jgi:DNA (cytosine-5)-methyltransferase 1